MSGKSPPPQPHTYPPTKQETKPQTTNLEYAADDLSSLEKNEPNVDTAYNLTQTDKAAAQLAADNDEIVTDPDLFYSLKQLKKLTLRTDFIILPLIGICYIFFYVDKTTLSYAAIFGIKEDLDLYGDRYNWLSSIFYFGYMAWSFPNNYLLLKLPVGKFLGFNIFLWGVLLMCQAACNSYGALLACRFLGGAFESIADPAYMLITAMWYTRREQPIRIGIWYTFNGIGIACGGLLGYGIGNIKGALASWRYEFLIIGALCAFWGIMIALLMPDNPLKTHYFNNTEKKILVHKLKENQTGIETKIFKWYQVKEAFMDPKMYMLFLLCMLGNIPNGVVSNFGTLIIQGLGYSTLITTVLQVPYGVYIALAIISCVFINDYFILKLQRNMRCFWAAIYILPNIAGAFGLRFVPERHSVGKLICYYLTGTYNASFVMILSLSTSNVAGHTKKIVFNAFIFLGYCVGNIAGPFFCKTEQAPTYPLGCGAMIFANVAEVAVLGLFVLYSKWENNKRDKEQGISGGGIGEGVVEHSFEDLTDYENRSFRYIY